MKLNRLKPEPYLQIKEDKIADLIPLVDADYLVYSCGMAGQYTLKHLYHKNGERATFRYVKEMKEFLEQEGWEEGDYTTEYEERLDPLPNILHSVDVQVSTIFAKFGRRPQLYLTGKNNYRELLPTEVPYKGNRWTAQKREEARDAGKWLDWLDETQDTYAEPVAVKYKQDIIDHLVNKYDAELVHGMEADDKVSILQYADWEVADNNKDYCNTVIVHVDKDIDMVPGYHYNPTKDEFYFIDEITGWKNYHIQLLTGDRVDNISGLHRVGNKRAEKILEGCTTPVEFTRAVYNAYKEHYPDVERAELMQMIQVRGDCLWMLRDIKEKENILKSWEGYSGSTFSKMIEEQSSQSSQTESQE